MSNLTHVSASSITLFSECQRKWYHRYVLGHKGETSDAMRRGTQVHEQLETFLTTGSLIDTDSTPARIAASGLPHIADLNVKAVEASLDDYPLKQSLGVAFRGFIDVLAVSSETEVHILDHKTTSDLKYAKTPAELAENIQLVIYAKHVMDNNDSYTHARLTHVYYTTKKPFDSRRVDVVLSREEVNAAFAGVARTVSLMLDATERPMDEAERNFNYCRAYNKLCDHYDDCFVSIQKKVSEPVSEKKMNLMAFLRGDTESIPAANKENNEGAVGSTDQGAVGSNTPAAVGSTTPAAVGSVEVGTVLLYVGVMALGAGVVVRPLADALAPLIDEATKAHGVEHIALAPYGGGWNTLAALVATRGLPAGHWYVDPNSQLYTRIAEDLHRKCDVVFIAAGR